MRLLSESARHVVYPRDDIVDTTWPILEHRLGEMGIFYDPWQQGLAQIVLGKRADDKYAATIGGVTLSIPRQVGKTFFVMSLLVAMCLEYPGLQVVWTSHHLRTSTKTFRTMQGIVRRKQVASFLAVTSRSDGIRTSNGEQEVAFRNGSLFMFGARSEGFGRGFDRIDAEVFDEAQILDSKSLEDMVAATNQTQHPHGALLFFMGTPPTPRNTSEEFSARRADALAGKSEHSIYVEFSADRDADPDDPEQWEKANPSFPERTPLESMQRLRANLKNVDSWKREGLGIWDPVDTGGVIPEASWASAADWDSIPTDRFAVGVECGPDLRWASVSMAGQRADGEWHIGVADDQNTKGRGTAWLVPYLEHLLANNPQIRSVVVDVVSPIAPLIEERTSGRWFFKGTKIQVTAIKARDLANSCALVLDGVVTGWLHHTDQPMFTAAALAAAKRTYGNDSGLWVWDRKTAESDITQIQAATLALHGAQATKVKQPAKSGQGRMSGNRSNGNRRGVLA